MSSEATIPTPRLAAPESAAVTAPPVSTGPERPLDIRALLHPAEHSRLLIALSSSAVVFGVAAMIVYKSSGWTALPEYAVIFAAACGLFWLSLQVFRSRLLGGAVRVSETTFPDLQVVFDEVRGRLDYYKDIDVYVMDKVDGGSSMTSYLGTRLILIEGGLVAELLDEERHAELVYLLGRHVGQLKARHQRLLPVMIAISMVHSMKFMQLFLAPYYRATAKSGDQIAAACCGDIRATAGMMNRLLVGKELGPRLVIKGVLDQAAAVRRRWLPRLAQLFMNLPHATNRYLNLLAFFARVAPEEIGAWRASLDQATAGRLAAAIGASPNRHPPRRRMSIMSALLATLITGGLLVASGWVLFGVASGGTAAAAEITNGNTPADGQATTSAGGQAAAASQRPEPGPTGSAAPSPQPQTGITATLSTYFSAINGRNYRLAWSQLSPADQSANPYPGFAAGQSTTTIRSPMLHGIAPGSLPGTYIASITFQSHQNPSEAPNQRDSCDDWTLNYTMIESSGRWLIDAANPQPGVPAYQSCG
jgi:hypothetical protein